MGGGRGSSTKNLSGSNNNGGVGDGVGSGSGSGSGSIPAGARKIVQSLKEIVNCPEAEIYAMLKECNMDPNETVNRLLSQDTFHEVKSKREKKKENKETSDFKPRAASGTSNRGRAGADRYSGRGSSSQYSASDSGALHARPAYKKDNGSTSHANSMSSSSGFRGQNTNWRPTSNSEVAVNEDKFPALGMTDNSSSFSQPTSGYQSAWVGAPGQVSMADIVKMGKPISKGASSYHNANQGQSLQPASYNSWASEDHNSKVSMENFDSGVHHVSVDDEWPLMEQPLPANVPSVSKIPVDHGLHVETSNLSSDTSNSQLQREETQQVEDDPVEDHGANHDLSASFSDRNIQEDASEDAALYENELYPTSYQPQHGVEHEEVANASIPVASVAANLQNLSIQKEDRELPSERVAPSVVIPDHLQAQSVDCSHLSFGSFRSGLSPAFSGPSVSMPVQNNSEEASGEVGVSSVGQSDNRESEYYMEESLRNESDAKMFHRTGAGTYESSAPQPEQLKVENPEMGHGSQYAFASTPGYAYENSQQLNAGYSQSQTSSQMQNLVSFPNAMPSYPDSLSNTLLAGNIPPVRESDMPYSPFPMQQSMAAKYGTAASSISGPTISMAEVLKAASFSSTQPNSQTITGTSVATGPALPQHLAAHPYSQHGLHLPFISYPLFAQSYAYAPPNYQQAAFAGNNTYHQNLAAVLPQYKDSVSASSLPQSASVASGYGALGGSNASMPGNFPMNPPSGPSAANLIYDDLLSAPYKDLNHLMSLQQNDSNGSWLQGPGSRMMSALPNPYISYQGQNQQQAGFRQAQQPPSQNYGALGYPNFYHSQAGMSMDQQQQQQQQNTRDRQLGGGGGNAQMQPKQQSQQQQIWQNNY